ncbi:MAG TPA: FGGY family carbohydrate kinase [Acidimicrobiales bacterium]|nr:FGGY family carbohydrate kinase [Acidimicrobiales bacterium]
MEHRALALDLGSSSVRAIVFERDSAGDVGAVAGAMARRPRHIDAQAPGQATFDAEEYFADLVACIDELHAKGALEGVEAIAADSQWHSVVPVGSSGTASAPVLSWADTRPPRPRRPRQPSAASLEALRQRTGCAYASMYWTWRVPWLVGNEDKASALPKGTKFLGLAEYVGMKLLADPTMSVSMASATGLLATAEHDWDGEALALAGLGGQAAAALPPLADRDWRGELAEQWRWRWPEIASAPWHPVLGDGAAANLGAGCDVPGRAAMTVGTSAAVRAVLPAPHPGPLPPGLWRYCVDDDHVVLGAAYSSGGQLYTWALRLWEGTTNGPGASASTPPGVANPRFDMPVPAPPGSDGVTVLPWHAGTRPPEAGVPSDMGAVLGLGLGHTGAHIVSASVEAVCFQLVGGLRDLEQATGGPLVVYANGGAVERSSWWQKRLAAAVGRPIYCPVVPETTSRGAAAKALGVRLSEAKAVPELVTPSAEEVAALAKARQRWTKWYGDVLPLVVHK